MDVNNIILNYIKENKRKIYGGYAQNQLIKLKNRLANATLEEKQCIPNI